MSILRVGYWLILALGIVWLYTGQAVQHGVLVGNRAMDPDVDWYWGLLWSGCYAMLGLVPMRVSFAIVGFVLLRFLSPTLTAATYVVQSDGIVAVYSLLGTLGLLVHLKEQKRLNLYDWGRLPWVLVIHLFWVGLVWCWSLQYDWYGLKPWAGHEPWIYVTCGAIFFWGMYGLVDRADILLICLSLPAVLFFQFLLVLNMPSIRHGIFREMDFSMLAVICVPLLCYFLLTERGAGHGILRRKIVVSLSKIASGLLVCFFVYLVATNDVRAAITCLPILGLAWYVISNRKKAMALVGVPVLVVCVFLIPYLNLSGRFAYGDQGANAFTSNRLKLWYYAVDAYRAHPVFGVGPGQFQGYLTHYNATQHTRLTVNHPHNHLLALLSEQGSLGAILFVVLIGMTLSGLYRLSHFCRHEEPGATSRLVFIGLLGFLYMSTFVTEHDHPLIYLFCGLTAAMSRMISGSVSQDEAMEIELARVSRKIRDQKKKLLAESSD